MEIYKLWKKAFLECYIQIVQFLTENICHAHDKLVIVKNQ